MRRAPRSIVLFATLMALAATAACGSSTPTPSSPPTSGGTFPVTVGSLTLPAKPLRIVSLSATATEMLYAVDAGQQVVAVDSFSTFPTTAPKTDLSAYKPNAEAIAGYRPDLVILSNDSEKIVDQLRVLKIPTFLAPAANTLEDTYTQITQVGALTGHPAEATAVNERIRDDIAKLVKDVPARAKALTYYYELDQTFFTVTSKTFIGSLFTSLGLVNIADVESKDGNPYPQLSAESIVKANPDLIFLADTVCCGQSPDTVGKRAGWATITAVAKSQVVGIDDDIASRWGPRVVDLLRIVATAVAKVPAA